MKAFRPGQARMQRKVKVPLIVASQFYGRQFPLYEGMHNFLWKFIMVKAPRVKTKKTRQPKLPRVEIGRFRT
jgi:hypothetical protein